MSDLTTPPLKARHVARVQRLRALYTHYRLALHGNEDETGEPLDETTSLAAAILTAAHLRKWGEP